MIAVRATYDGKSFKPLDAESLPKVEEEVPVTILFPDTQDSAKPVEMSQREIIEAMWAARAKMQPLGMSIPEMIEEGRER
ncbi:MAG TPA: hypothetical protein PLD20_19060 [Blastocatellia bacterium]|nr:hypothetical protein [Blastocatellia bacterium]HMV86395.1 hypothetical protein [Blastocatellia bacterium]HMX26942.1 hypothetical protein [Blastocatellia bacterium]HMY74072.1 hypothetical protein [Blastocatellia bacterium]HMZ20046.1 hypothetical protein [Blastocatellia bacterium]